MQNKLPLLHSSPVLASYSTVSDAYTPNFKQLLHPVEITRLKVHCRALTCPFLMCSITARVVWTGQEGLAAQLTSVAAAAAASVVGVSDHRAVDKPTQTLYSKSPYYSSKPTTESVRVRVFVSGEVPCLF